MTPILHRIFVLPEKVEEADETIRRARAVGIHVELDKREHAAVTIGTVVAIGSTCYKEFNSSAEEQGVQVGSKVVYAKYSGAKMPGVEYICLNDEDIIAVV